MLAMNGRAIQVDDQCCTSMRNVWAIGDLTGEPMLAHRAMAQGEMVAEIISGKRRHFTPAVVHSQRLGDDEETTEGFPARRRPVRQPPHRRLVIVVDRRVFQRKPEPRHGDGSGLEERGVVVPPLVPADAKLFEDVHRLPDFQTLQSQPARPTRNQIDAVFKRVRKNGREDAGNTIGVGRRTRR